MLKQKNKKLEMGITLIALVVTVIVLIILAGVSIAMLVGENGIITQAQRAAQETEIKGDEEKIRLAINTAQIENNGNANIEKDDLEIALLENGTKSIVVDNEDGTRNVIFLDSKKIYKLNSDGSIEDTNSDFDSIYVAPDSQDEARNEGVIGIGTDGQPVDMDLWEYTLLEDGTYGLNTEETVNDIEKKSSGYKGSIASNNIEGTIPVYIKKDENWKPVTDLTLTFYNQTELIEFPQIPSTVNSIVETFYGCTNLKDTNIVISGSVIDMRGAFYGCASIVTSPSIPSSVREIDYLFKDCTALKNISNIPNVTSLAHVLSGCSNLKEIPKIPETVTNLRSTFINCTNLEKAPDLPDSIINMDYAFSGTALTVAPVIPSKVESMFNTFYNCKELVTASAIPSSVTNIANCYRDCPKLEGILEINANVTGKILGEEYYNNSDYHFAIYNSVTEEGKYLKVTGSCTLLEEIIHESKNSNASLLG